MPNKARYIQKIKKLLNKARNNSSPSEAATAMKMAQKMMQEHQLNESDFLVQEVSESCTKGAPSNATSIPKYMAMLAEIVCRAFGVKNCFSWHQGREKRVVIFYGPAERSEVAAYAFDVMSRQMMKGRKEYIASMRKNTKHTTKTSRGDVWCEAWVHGAYQVLDDFVVSDDEHKMMEAYRKKMVDSGSLSELKMREVKRKHGHDDATFKGFSAGQQAKIYHGMKGDHDSAHAQPTLAIAEGSSC